VCAYKQARQCARQRYSPFIPGAGSTISPWLWEHLELFAWRWLCRPTCGTRPARLHGLKGLHQLLQRQLAVPQLVSIAAGEPAASRG
jgi:hypothetical protein